ncbi:hypothetical protein BELL_0588g00090 [Botrytis elliptica]|uniref:RanBD1 domain-containing protein n=1 Tax=Botrytis elliptica TaxID=278938 RepID=A0A4Z1JCR2_9HELO|nr:hypothetical protein EAE99_005460 [Botrytis elliptica]TGO71358.1 hypothetical protein BELL_0588g00090 [Botrytis elliptica]
MNSPQQANAAQLAARSIKAKPRGRLAGQKSSGFPPLQNNNPNNNAAVGGGSGGGLFGGSVAAPGSFNFSAPAGTPSFSPSFGESTPNPFAQSAASTNHDDPRADTTGEEALRKSKVFSGGFRAAGENEEALFASHSPFHHNNQQQQSNTLGSSNNTQPQNMFGATNATQSNAGGFQFGSSTSQNQTSTSGFGGFNFTPTSQAADNNSSSTFAFGSSSQAPPAVNNSTPAFNFGATNSGSAENSLNFGANSLSKAPNPLTLENQKASNVYSDPSQILFGSNNSPTTFSNYQPGNSTFDQQFFHSNEDAGNMFGNHKVEYPPEAGQAPVQPSQIQHPMGQLGLSADFNYRGSFLARPTESLFGNGHMLTDYRANQNQFVQENSSTSFGQNNTNNSFGAQNNSFGGSFGGGFGNKANTSFTGLSSTNAAPSSSQNLFGNTTATTSAPSSSFTSSFPATSAAPSTTNLFGSTSASFPTTSAPTTTNLFGSVNSSFPPATASSTPLFGAAKPAEATPAASSNSFFGSAKPAESTPSTSSTSFFGSVKPAESAPTAPSNSLFGSPKPAESTASTPSNSLFGGFKPTDSTPTSSSTSNIFGKPPATPASSTPFTGFGKQAESTPNLFNPNNQINGQSNNLFGSKSAEEPKDKQTLDLFSPNRPAGQQLFESNATNSSPEKASAQTPNALFASFGKTNSSTEHQLGGAAKEQAVSFFPDSSNDEAHQANIPQSAAPSTSQSESSFKIRGTAEASSFNKASSPFKSVDTPTDAAQPVTSNLFGGFSSKIQDSQPSNGSLSNGSDSYSMALTAPTDSSSQSPPSNSKALAPVKRALAPGRLSDFEFQVSEPTDMEMDTNMPVNFNTVQRREFKALWRIASVQRSMAAYFQHLPPGADPSKGLAWMEAKKREILAEYNIDHISNKRDRAAADLENGENQENRSPQKRVRQDRERSHRIPSPEKRSRSTRSPERQRSRATHDSESEINGNSVLKAPKLQPGRSSSPSKSPSRSAAPEPTPSKKRRSETQSEIGGESSGHKKRRPEQSNNNEGIDSGNSKKNEEVDTGSSKKRRAEVYLTQNDPEGIEDGKNSNKKTLNGSSSSTSNMFKNILDSPDKSTRSVSPERKTRALPGATKEAASVPAAAPVTNPFGNLAGASPIKSNTAATSTTPSKPPVFTFAPTSTTPTTSPTKPPTFTGTSGIKPPTFAGAPTGGIKPPTFGSAPVNFMAQFGKKAVEYAEDNEKILMQKAKDEDFDSEDDDEAEWEAKYKEKRAAELKELEELAKAKAPSFLVKSTDTPKATEPKETVKPAATNMFGSVAPTTSTTLFGQAKPATGAAESIFNSANTSRASTPNLFSSTGSVLDGAASAPGKTPSFSGNPFAHLSDAESKNQNDEDDGSSDGGSNSDGEGEKKDPSYQPKPSKTNTSTPGTPVDENGSNIFSKKAPTEPPTFNLFGSAAKTDAAKPTPGTGGSLSSRMSFGAAPEEKDDLAPKPATNIFGNSFGATSSTPEDKTWKPNTPIKFGSDAPSAPVFNFTSATPSSSTPTKPSTNPSGGLFGSSGTSASTLFGGSTTTTGFQFGGPPSAPASSFPSADASRANSPGATTDGADDNDPEKVHAQVNLLESSPGEEHEDAVYSVRTRALKFNPAKAGEEKSSPWDTKGVGPLKVLCHKETKATRIVLRSDPSGSIIINRSLLSQFKYEASGKTVKLNTVGDDGKLETWVLQLKNVELAEEFAKSLEENKINNK